MNDIHILVVDDEKDLLTSFVECYGNRFNLITASTYDEAVAALNNDDNEIGVIITDQRMPKHKGNDLLQYADEHHPNIICMLMTGYSDIEDTTNAVNSANVEYYVEKPWEIDELEEWLSNSLYKYKKTCKEKVIVKKKEEWVQSLIERESFISNMAHELRTPVIGVINHVNDLLLGALDPDQLKIAEDLHSASDYLLHFVNDLLDIVKIEANQFTLEAKPFDLKKVFLDTEKILKSRLHKGVSLDITVDVTCQYLLGDAHRLQQILLNLGSNAAKFTQHGCITISAKCAESNDGLKKIIFKIIDTGIGIPEEKIETLFKPFIQSDNTISRKYGGTGLGLSLVKKLVELQQGELGVKSQENEGSTFWFSIDFQEAKLESIKNLDTTVSMENATSLISKMQFRKVLLAEDDLTSQKIMKKIFDRIGVTYDIVENGKELVEQFKKTRYDMVITDFNMPLMTGLEAAKVMRAYEINSNQSKTPIIISSSNREEEMHFDDAEKYYDEMMPKPFRLDHFLNMVNRHT